MPDHHEKTTGHTTQSHGHMGRIHTHMGRPAGGRLGEAYGEEVAAVGDVSKDREGIGVRDGGGDGSEVVGVEAAVGVLLIWEGTYVRSTRTVERYDNTAHTTV
jgi:hypothetical protein